MRKTDHLVEAHTGQAQSGHKQKVLLIRLKLALFFGYVCHLSNVASQIGSLKQTLLRKDDVKQKRQPKKTLVFLYTQ